MHTVYISIHTTAEKSFQNPIVFKIFRLIQSENGNYNLILV